MISIIIAVYNAEKYLPQCIESVLRQTYRDIEVILVDDGSTDESLKICREYALKDDRVTVFNMENKGHIAARKCGALAAKGEYMTFVDSDDWMEPEMYEAMMSCMEERHVDVVMTGRFEDTGNACREVYHGIPEGRYDEKALHDVVFPRMIVGGDFFDWNIFPGFWDKLFRRDAIMPFIMPADERIAVGGDAAVVYPCLLHARSIYIMEQCFYHYRQRTDSIVRRRSDRETERMRYKLLYEVVAEYFDTNKHICDLREQWKKYVLFLMLPRADSLHENFENLDYLFPFPNVPKGSDIILYGAGMYGQRLYAYLQKSGFCSVAAWVDRNHKELRGMGLPVQPPDVINDVEHDAIVIANTYAKSRQGLYGELIGRYSEEKIHMIDEELIFSEETMRAFDLERQEKGNGRKKVLPAR